VPIHEPDLAAHLGYGDGTFPPGRRDEDDQRTATAALRAAEAEAARLLRSGGRPVAVSWRPGAAPEHDDLLVVSAPVERLEEPLARVADESPGAGIVVVTGDPSDDGDEPRRRERLRAAIDLVGVAQRDGVRIVGTFHQPAVDGYEWHRGFEARLGLFDRDRNARFPGQYPPAP
jgi:beta-glucosidase/6-phospho-beta-glucosidase/beta-galactosidase